MFEFLEKIFSYFNFLFQSSDLHELWQDGDEGDVEESAGSEGEDVHEEGLQAFGALEGQGHQGAQQPHQRSGDLGPRSLPPEEASKTELGNCHHDGV